MSATTMRSARPSPSSSGSPDAAHGPSCHHLFLCRADARRDPAAARDAAELRRPDGARLAHRRRLRRPAARGPRRLWQRHPHALRRQAGPPPRRLGQRPGADRGPGRRRPGTAVGPAAAGLLPDDSAHRRRPGAGRAGRIGRCRAGPGARAAAPAKCPPPRDDALRHRGRPKPIPPPSRPALPATASARISPTC